MKILETDNIRQALVTIQQELFEKDYVLNLCKSNDKGRVGGKEKLTEY